MKSETKGRKVEGIATVSYVGSWLPLTGPQWYNPAVDFELNGETLQWRSSSEQAVRGLERGTTVQLRAFVKPNGHLYRVTWTPTPTVTTTAIEDAHAVALLERNATEVN